MAEENKASAIVEPADRSKWELVKPRNARADVWEHFGRYSITNDPRQEFAKVAVCKLCRKELQQGETSSTTSMSTHLQVCQPNVVYSKVHLRIAIIVLVIQKCAEC